MWLSELKKEEKEQVHEANFWFCIFYIFPFHFETNLNDTDVDVLMSFMILYSLFYKWAFSYSTFVVVDHFLFKDLDLCFLSSEFSNLMLSIVYNILLIIKVWFNYFFLVLNCLTVQAVKWRGYLWFVKNNAFKIDRLKIECYIVWSLNICSHRFLKLIQYSYFLFSFFNIQYLFNTLILLLLEERLREVKWLALGSWANKGG